jgi:hypothetical protein
VGIDLQPRVEHQLCVPAIAMNVQSYRQRSAATRQQQRTSSDSKRDTKQKEIINASST